MSSLELIHNVERSERVTQLIDGHERLGHDWLEVWGKMQYLLEVLVHFEGIDNEMNNSFFAVMTLVRELKEKEFQALGSGAGREAGVMLGKLTEENKGVLNRLIVIECGQSMESMDENSLRENALFILNRVKKMMENLDRKLLVLQHNYEEYLNRGKFKGPFVIELMRHYFLRLSEYLAELKKITERMLQITRQRFMPMDLSYDDWEEAFAHLYHCLGVLRLLRTELKDPLQLRNSGLIPKILDSARVIPYTAEQMDALIAEELKSVDHSLKLRKKYVKELVTDRLVNIVERASFKREYEISTDNSNCNNLEEVMAEFAASFADSSHNYELPILREVEAALDDEDLGQAEQLVRMYFLYTNDGFRLSKQLRDMQFIRWMEFENKQSSLSRGKLTLIKLPTT